MTLNKTIKKGIDSAIKKYMQRAKEKYLASYQTDHKKATNEAIGELEKCTVSDPRIDARKDIYLSREIYRTASSDGERGKAVRDMYLAAKKLNGQSNKFELGVYELLRERYFPELKAKIKFSEVEAEKNDEEQDLMFYFLASDMLEGLKDKADALEKAVENFPNETEFLYKYVRLAGSYEFHCDCRSKIAKGEMETADDIARHLQNAEEKLKQKYLGGMDDAEKERYYFEFGFFLFNIAESADDFEKAIEKYQEALKFLSDNKFEIERAEQMINYDRKAKELLNFERMESEEADFIPQVPELIITMYNDIKNNLGDCRYLLRLKREFSEWIENFYKYGEKMMERSSAISDFCTHFLDEESDPKSIKSFEELRGIKDQILEDMRDEYDPILEKCFSLFGGEDAFEDYKRNQSKLDAAIFENLVREREDGG
jgi:hypothetical protein